MRAAGRIEEDAFGVWKSGWMPTILCTAAMLVWMMTSIFRPLAMAWGEEGVPAVYPPGDSADRVESRSPEDLEMLRRLLEMTIQQPPGSGERAAPAGAGDAAPTAREVASPLSSSRRSLSPRSPAAAEG